MSPIKIVRSREQDGITYTHIQEAATPFPVGSGDAARILGVSRTTLHRLEVTHLKRPITRSQSPSGRLQRAFSDEDLLTLADQLNGERVVVIRHSDSPNKAHIISRSCSTFVVVPDKK